MLAQDHQSGVGTTAVEVGAVVLIGGVSVAGATQSSETGPILAFAGAVLVALIAAFAAQRRLRQQLTAEHARHAAQLEAERQRQAAQLAHDRELADLADLRALLDEAAVALDRANYARADLGSAYRSHGKTIREKAPEIVQAINQCGQTLDAIAARLGVRLGADDPVTAAFDKANTALLTMSHAVAWLEDDTAQVTREKNQRIKHASDTLLEAASEFQRAAVERAGVAPASERTAAPAGG